MKILTTLFIGLVGLTSVSRGVSPNKATVSMEEMKATIKENAPGRPTIIANIDSYEDFINYDFNADSVLFHLNSFGFVVDLDDAPIASLDEAFSKYQNKTLMNFEIKSSDAYSELSKHITKNQLAFTDINIFCNKLDVINTIKFWDGAWRVGYDVRDVINPQFNQIRRDSNVYGAHFIIATQSDVDYDTVESIQHLAKPVWVEAETEEDNDIAYCYGTGAMGLISTNHNAAIRVLYELCKAGPTVFRSTYNIAHRGDATNYGENSLEGFKAVYKKGAQAFETDFHVTKDKQIVAMHDTTIDKTTNGTGAIADMTLAELRQYKIVKNCNGDNVDPVNIPTLDEIFEFMSGNDIILFAEIKCSDSDFASIFKSKVDEYKLSDRIVIINFETLIFFVPTVGQLSKCRIEMPEIWGLNLMWFDLLPDLTSAVESRLQIGYDANLTVLGIIEDGYFEFMRDRGFLCAGWSLIDDETWNLEIYKSIVYAYTNNYPYDYANYPAKINATIDLEYKEPHSILDTEIEAEVTDYVGNKSNVKATVYSISLDGATCIYRNADYQIVFNTGFAKTKANLGLILGTTIPAGIIIIGIGALVTLSILKKKKR